MPFSLGFTADAAAAHRHEFSQPETTSSMLGGMLGFPKLRDGSLSRHSTPVLTPRPSQNNIEVSSSEEEEEEEEETAAAAAEDKNRARPGQKSARPKTVFQFAHPVANRHRLKLRLKLLLQLHEISRSSRAFPIYDVLPADVPTKLIFRIPKPYGTTRAFGPRDMVIVASDMYEQQGSSDDRSVSSEESCQEQREVLATICQSALSGAPRKPVFEVAFSSGVYWEGIQLPGGSYELVSRGEAAASRKVRWVVRDRKPVRQGSGMSSSSTSGASRFTFSVINPNTRQHPVIASMTRKGLTVFDNFSYPAAFSKDDEQSPPGSPSSASTESRNGRGIVNTDDDLRKLIVMTGIWVAFMEGWSCRSPLGGEASNRTDSPLSPRSRSSTFLSADGDAPADNRRSLSACPSAFNSVKVINRRSTQSDLGGGRSDEPGGICRIRRSKSLTAADRDVHWTSVETGGAAVSSQSADHGGLDTGHLMRDEGASKTRPKVWRRLSTMLRRKK